MPERTRVEQLISQVEQGRIIEAINEFYADDVVMQENANSPTVGKNANLRREEGFVGSIDHIHENRAASFVVDGDRVVIAWILDFTDTSGKRLRFDQLAYQTWRGDRIVHERFYYDSAGLTA